MENIKKIYELNVLLQVRASKLLYGSKNGFNEQETKTSLMSEYLIIAHQIDELFELEYNKLNKKTL